MIKGMNKIGLIFGLFVVSQLLVLNARAQNEQRYQAEYLTALKLIQNNLQTNGGTVAAPSHGNPDYFYDWVRDTSVTMKNLIEIAYDPKTDPATAKKLQIQIDLWVNWELGLQTAYQPPTDTQGNALYGLGEPRFFLSGFVNNNPWGRPQNDGPASRALAGITLAQIWIAQGRLADVTSRLYRMELPANTLIKRDLEYVAYHWRDPSVDLWEEEKADHFYTLTVQKVSLIKGAALARMMGDGGAADFYEQQSQLIDAKLQSFYDPSQNLIQYAININPMAHKSEKTTALDVAVLLAAIQTFDGQFYVPVAQVVATVQKLTDWFKNNYSINQVTVDPVSKMNLGVALGRYPHDQYDGISTQYQDAANPWFLATLALGEFACDLKAVGYKASTGLGSSPAELTQVAFNQFNRVLYHMNADGALSEQFNRDNGFEMSAPHLTWSYTSYLSAYRACF